METTSASVSQASVFTSMTGVHAAWLAAGTNSDAAAMLQLHSQFPEWLDFNRRVGPPTSDSQAQRQAKFCCWGDFHLCTLGASALHTAAWGGDLDIMRFLLESGQNPDADGDGGMTAMMVAILRLDLMTMRCVFRDGEACREEQDQSVQLVLEVIKLLLHLSAEVDARAKDGKTALHCSTSDDTYDAAKFLLDAGARMDAQDANGKTPLHYCVQEDGLLVTDLLLSRGANIDLEDKDGISPLALVLQRSNLNMLQLFLNHHQLVATPKRLDFGGAVLMQAVGRRAEEVVRYIVENEYSSITVCDEYGETPMHRAIKQRNPSIVELLHALDPAGDNLAAVTCELETPTHYAARHSFHRELELLLQCLTSVFGDLQELGPANPLNAVDNKGRTSLYIAGSETDATTRDSKVQLLLNHGARLFPPEFLAHELAHKSSGSDSALKTSRLVFPAKVQQCLRTWIIEDRSRSGEPEDEDAASASDDDVAEAELCMQCVDSVACTGSWVSLLPILICAGYEQDVVPLLVEFPLGRCALPALLCQLEKFSKHQRHHTFLLQLHKELLEACV